MRSPLTLPLVSIPARTRVFPLGSAGLPTTIPLLEFRNGLNIPSDGEYGLAIVGQGEGRRRLVQTLLSKYRFHPHPPAPGIFPYAYHWARESHAQGGAIHDPIQPPPSIRHLTFSKPSLTGEFTDFTARYGALQEEDADTLLQFFRGSLFPSPKEDAITAVASILRIEHLLHLPLVALSSGQTRRSRIAAGLLAAPRMLIVEDPFAGLDVQSREEIAVMLGRVNSRGVNLHTAGRGADDTEGQGMRLVLSLRGTASIGLPRYVTHVARVMDDEVETLSKEEYVERVKDEEATHHVVPGRQAAVAQSVEPSATKPVVDVQGVSITYGETKVLDNVSWRIHPGERWHLRGSNGCGKTTLLSLILGHHPKSFSLPAQRLAVFGHPRREWATPTLRRRIGHASPEVFAAFPRGMGLSAGEAVGTGFEGIFARRRMTEEQRARIRALLDPFVDLLDGKRRTSSSTVGRTTTTTTTSPLDVIYDTDFSHFPPNQQALLLFLRAIVARPPLLILDEASQGMDEETWARCRVLLEKEWAEIARDAQQKTAGHEQQAVVVVSHWEEEVPWEAGKGQVLWLHEGRVVRQE